MEAGLSICVLYKRSLILLWGVKNLNRWDRVGGGGGDPRPNRRDFEYIISVYTYSVHIYQTHTHVNFADLLIH